MKLLRPEIFRGRQDLCCALGVRSAGALSLEDNFSFYVGDSEERVRQTRGRFFGELLLKPDDLASPRQVHGNAVVRADAPGMYGACDGLVTERPGLPLGVLVADCVPLFLFDPQRRIIAAVHAGWRGTSSGIAGMAVRKMRQEFGSDPADLLAFIGPAAGSCCYRVGEEVAAHFDEADVRRAEDGIFLDLKRANARQLGGEGIPASQMEISPSCTISDGAMFHSYRRDGVRSGRMLGVIALTGRKPAR